MSSRGKIFRCAASGLVSLLALCAGCAPINPTLQTNPTTVYGGSDSAAWDRVWDSTICVVERYFDVAYEDRWFGRIETKPQASATLFEPQRLDAVGIHQRLEATLQTIRRRAFVLIQPSSQGGYFDVTVEVYKELEDLSQPVFTSFGGGTFIPSVQPFREAIVTSPVRPTDGWISLGRDGLMESRIIEDLQCSLGNAAQIRSAP